MRVVIMSVMLSCFALTNARAGDCYKTTIQEPQPFLGNGGELVVLSDGSVWKNTSYRYAYMYAYYPTVILCPGDGEMVVQDKTFTMTRVGTVKGQ